MPKAAVSHIRIYEPAISRRLSMLAERNRRTMQAEGILAIETHLDKHRASLKNGKRMPQRKSRQ